MRMPYDGYYRFTQRYGSNKSAYARFGTPDNPMLGHNGIDVALPLRTPLKAVRKGKWARWSDPTGYGINGILTDEDGGEWMYAHLAEHAVRDGAAVEEGDLVAYSDNTGNSTGNHLHFAYRPRGYNPRNGYFGWINPRPFLPQRYRIALQTGHVPDGGGAPSEANWTPRMADALALRLSLAGVDPVIVGGFYGRTPPPILGGDFDLFLALHYDARYPDSYTTGCCIARGRRLENGVWIDTETEYWEADRFITHWKSVYPAATGIPLKDSRVGVNMEQYYAYRALSYVTPGIVIEHGVGAPGIGGDADLLWNHLDTVAGIEAGIILDYLAIQRWEPEAMARLNDEELYTVINNGWQQLVSPGVPCNRSSAHYKLIVDRLRNEKVCPLPYSGEYDHGLTQDGKPYTSQWWQDGTMSVWVDGMEKAELGG